MKSYEESSQCKSYFEVFFMGRLFLHVKQTKFSFLICASVVLSTSVDTHLWIHVSQLLHPSQASLTFHCSVLKQAAYIGRIWLLYWFHKSIIICTILAANFDLIITRIFTVICFFIFSSFLLFLFVFLHHFLSFVKFSRFH